MIAMYCNFNTDLLLQKKNKQCLSKFKKVKITAITNRFKKAKMNHCNTMKT